jgi:VIT1/CCC1 family predicted Fe2+/Mn2+ transporter
MKGSQLGMVREAVAVFRNEKDMQAAIDDLLTHGFDRAEISLLASTQAVETKLGHRYRSVRDLEDDPQAPTIAYATIETSGAGEGAVIATLTYLGALAAFVPVVAGGGALAGALIAMAVGGGSGAAIGAVLARLIDRRHADYIADQLSHGGLVLWVRTWSANDEVSAVRILKSHFGEDVHVLGVINPSSG